MTGDSAGASCLFLIDQVAEGLFGFGAGGLVVLRLLFGALLSGDEALRELVGLLALVGEVGHALDRGRTPTRRVRRR